MDTNSQWVHAGKRRLKLSNLEKILFPQSGIIKAEVIAYYHEIAPTLLYHIKGRPLTLIRYPDGIEGEHFYQKNRPRWAPGWVEFVTLGKEEQKDYMLASEQATLLWLANLAALELHQMHCRHPHFDRPDYMVFDLDPPESENFDHAVDVALRLKEHVQSYQYHPFVKTTGGKGLHVVIPVEPNWDFPTVFEAAKDMAQPFVNKYKDEITLQIKKNARGGRMLVDIYRNRNGQSIVSPYSLRGRLGAPVSMPVRWDELETMASSGHYHLRNAIEKVKLSGDAWEGIGGYAVSLHTKRHRRKAAAKLPASAQHKSPEQLKAYRAKRDFQKTPEPRTSRITEEGTNFVIHRHHASRLHYDLRLEQDGVLKSWAVPKGLPPRPGVKRLAVQTEDHPIEYLTFEGTIPKGEYGGGTMWVFASGRYEITKEKKDGMYLRLESPEVSGEYRMHRMKEKEWLLEKADQPQVDWLSDRIEPMQADSADTPPKGDYIYEMKWNGIRALIALEDGQLRMHTRNQYEVTRQFPELQEAARAFRATCGLFDAEIVCLDSDGRPNFREVVNRLKNGATSTIETRAKKQPACAYVFDCLYLDGRAIIHEPLVRRHEWLQDALRKNSFFRLSEWMDDGDAFFAAVKEYNLEGIMAKKKDSPYLPGRRSDWWQKIKVRRTADCLVIGYTKGKGDRAPLFGALHLAEKTDGRLQYRGKVGTGFDEATMNEIKQELDQHQKIKKPVPNKVINEKDTTWIEPNIIAEIQYASLTPDQIFREAVFLQLWPDLYR